MNKEKQSTYKCKMCHGVFEKGLNDEEAIQEKNEIFGNVPLSECDIVCDDCWNKIKPQ